MERHGLVPYYWDVGSYGDHGSGIFDRNTGAQVYPDIINAIIDTSDVSPVGGVPESPSIPTKFSLEQNYPNPFNPTTVISYKMPINSLVTIKVYDVLGRDVQTLVNERLNAGSHSVTFGAKNLPSGVYFYELRAGYYSSAKKLVLLK